MKKIRAHDAHFDSLVPARPPRAELVTVRVEVVPVSELKAASDITPQLDLNKPEVRKRIPHVMALCGISGLGMNCESLVFATDGTIIDGRQRVLACIQLGIPFVGVVVRGIQPTAIHASDLRNSRNKMKDFLDFVAPLPRKPEETVEAYASRMNTDGPTFQVRMMSLQLAGDLFPASMDKTLTPAQIVRSDGMARDIKADRWVLTGQTIKVGKTTRTLIDGRLTCRAVRIAGKEAACIVAWNVPEAYAATIQSGRKLSFGHRLHSLQLVDQAYAIAPALAMIHSYRVRNPQAEPTQPELFELWQEYPGITGRVAWARKTSTFVRMSVAVAMYELFAEQDEDLAKVFVNRLADKDSKDMFGRLRKEIKANGGTKNGGAAAELKHARWMILTWNSLVLGRDDVRFRNSEDWPSKLLKPGRAA